MIELDCIELMLDPGSGVLESLDAAGVECDCCTPHKTADSESI